MNTLRREETADSGVADLVARFRGRTVLVLGDAGEGTTATVELVRTQRIPLFHRKKEQTPLIQPLRRPNPTLQVVDFI